MMRSIPCIGLTPWKKNLKMTKESCSKIDPRKGRKMINLKNRSH